MSGRIHIVRIEFHAPNQVSYNYHGEDGYSLPTGRASATVVFQINESDGSHAQLTVVLAGTFASYDALVQEAYRRIAARLEGFGKTAEGLKRKEQERVQKQAEQQSA